MKNRHESLVAVKGDEAREATETECTLAYLPPSRSLLSQGDN